MNSERIDALEERFAALEVKLDAAVNHSSGQDDQLKVQHGKLGLLEAKLAEAEKKIARLQTDVMKIPPARATVDQAVAATPPPPPPGPPPNKEAKQGVPPPFRPPNQLVSDTGTPPPPGTPIRDDSYMFGYAPAPGPADKGEVPMSTLQRVALQARESLYFPPGPCPDCEHPWIQHSKGIPCLQAGCICMEEPASSPSPPPGLPNQVVRDTVTFPSSLFKGLVDLLEALAKVNR